MLTHAFLSSFLAFEGFVNYVAGIVDPVTWKYISRVSVYKKLDWLCEKLGIPINESLEPYVTWNDARMHRNSIAHAEVFRAVTMCPIDEVVDHVTYISAKWHDVLSREEVERIRNELSAFANLIQSKAKSMGHTAEDDDMTTPVLGKAGVGRLGYASVSTVVVESQVKTSVAGADA
jgi:hypothetical protein